MKLDGNEGRRQRPAGAGARARWAAVLGVALLAAPAAAGVRGACAVDAKPGAQAIPARAAAGEKVAPARGRGADGKRRASRRARPAAPRPYEEPLPPMG